MENIITILDPNRADIIKEMQQMDVHRTGISIMSPKAEFRIVKIKNIPVTAANIIKQDMLSFGGEAATTHGAINHSVKSTDILIFGTKHQINNLSLKLQLQQFSLRDLAEQIQKAINNHESIPGPIKIKGKSFDFSKRTYIMGILNVTPDSFSDGGRYFDRDNAISFGEKMIKDGADIIDIGGESTRPGATSVRANDEIKRVIPVIKQLAKNRNAIISIDTTKSKVAEAAINAGASMINDVSALRFDGKMAFLAAKYNVPVVLMHMLGNPRTMQGNPRYKDLISDIISCLQNSIRLAIKGGVSESKIIIDPGFGFGKTVEHNLEILRRLKEFKVIGRPIMIGTSRKSTIGKILDLPADSRMEGTAATVTAAIAGGVNIIRAHDVEQMAKVVRMSDAIYKR
jgi:dihydropteroate synthase